MAKIGRNAPCPCGSGKKYKKCCLEKEEAKKQDLLDERRRQQQKAEARRERERQQAIAIANEDKELFEDAHYDEEEEEKEEFYDDEMEDLELDEELDEDDEDRSTGESQCKQVSKDIPKISAEEEAIVDKWWEAYRKMTGADRIRQHLDDFLRDYPKLVPNLELHHEVLFELSHSYAEEDRHSEYIDLLLRIRNQFADSYLKSFGYYDRDIISHKMVIGAKDEIKDYLNYFREYPDHDPDSLFRVIEFLTASNCQETVSEFVKDIYYNVCTSSRIIGGDQILDFVVQAYFSPFLRPDFTDTDMEELATQLRTIRIPLRDEYHRTDFLRQRFELILNTRGTWDIDDCRTSSKISERYYEISLNYMGFLHEHKGKDWMASDFFRKLLLRYLINAIPEGKRPKQPFVFTRNKIETTIAKTCKSFLFLDSIAVFGCLNAIYWFAEYLEEGGSIAVAMRKDIQGWCSDLHAEVYPGLAKSHFSAKAFERFPL